MARRIRHAAAKGNLFVTSANGLMKMNASTGSSDMSLAGVPRCLDLVLSLVGAPGTLLTDVGTAPTAGSEQARGYRAVWCIRDAANNLIQGVPSARFFIVNANAGAGTTYDVQVVTQIPPEITTSHFLQLYATAIVDFGSTVDVGDEMRLVQEYFPTAANVTAGTCTLTDNAPNAFRGADLYTNESQEGQAAQNDRPPLGRDIVWFNNRLCVSNYTDKHRLKFQMVGTSGMTTQTITIGGVVYTAGTAENTTTGTFQVFKPGGGGYTDLGTQSLNVERTAKSFCYIINKYAATTGFYAYYESSTADAPGAILVEERGVGGSAFVAITSASTMGAMFSPIIPTIGSTYSSVADRRVNQIRVSKVGEPEHMPLVRNIIVGGEDEEIQRIVATRGSLIIIKDRSIWRLTEAEPGEAPQQIDNTCGVSGRDSVAVLNDAVYMISDQGFVSITDNGVQIVGRPIEDKVLAGLEEVGAPDHDRFVGVGYERQRYYMCTAYDAAFNEMTCFRYSPISNSGRGAWTRRRINANAFAVNGNRLHYALNNNYGHVMQERKSRRSGVAWYKDYAEETNTFNISSFDATAKTATGVFTAAVNYDGYLTQGPVFGWKLYDGSNQYVVQSVSGSYPNYVLTLNTAASLTTGVKSILRPMPWIVEYAPITAGNPLELKGFHEVLFKAETCNAHAVYTQFSNNIDTKVDPAQDLWDANPALVTTYVGPANGSEPSATNSDFGATPSTFNPFNEIRTLVPPTRAQGEHLSVIIAGGVAEGFVAIKALVVTVTQTASNRTRQ